MKRLLLPAATLTAAIVVLWGCTRWENRPPNVLLISIDTLRQDHVAAYGYDRPTTPALDRLAAEGARFANAWSTSSWTLPSHISALTGLLPSSHQVEGQNDRLSEEIATLAEAFASEGYASAGFVSHVYLDGQYGFSRGFDEYVTRPTQIAEEVTDQALGWLDDHRRRPFFLFLHYFDPHADYAPPAGYAERFDDDYQGPSSGEYDFLRQFEDPAVPLPEDVARHVVALYDGEIRYTDDQIGRVVDRLREDGRLDDTIVAVFSDHGEEFKEHGSFGHGGTLYSEVTRVPLILRYPHRIQPGTRVEHPSVIADLPAVISLLAGKVPEPQFVRDPSGARPIVEELAGEVVSPDDRRLILETTRDGPKRFSVLHRDYAYISPSEYVRLDAGQSSDGLAQNRIPIPEGLYNIADDPGQQVNLLGPVDCETPSFPDEVVESSRATVLGYIYNDVPGLRLLCRGTREHTARFEGTVRFEAAVPDEPLGYNLGEGDKLIPLGTSVTRLRSDHYGLELEVANIHKGVVFVPPAGSAQVQISLLLDGSSYHTGAVGIPPPGAMVPLGESGIPGVECSLDGGAAPLVSLRESVSLSAEQIDRLRSLGYVE